MEFNITIREIGGSKGIIIPLALLKHFKIEQVGTTITIRDETNKKGQPYATFWKKEEKE